MMAMRRSLSPPLRQFWSHHTTSSKGATAYSPAALICSKLFQRDDAKVVVITVKPWS